MSLLLEALKKAELAKQGALGTPPPEEEFDIGGIRFEEPNEPSLSTEPLADFPAPIMEQIPEEPIQSLAPPPPPLEAAPIVAAPRAPARPTAPPPEAEPPAPSPAAPQRAAARQVFEAKEVDYNPKRPFYITLAVLSLSAVGYGVYLWWQLQPRYSVNTTAIQNAPKSAPVAKSTLPPPPKEVEKGEPSTANEVPVADNKVETSQAPAPAPAPAPAKDVPAPAKAEPVKNTAAIASTPASAAPAKNAITVPAKPAGDVPPSVSTGKPAPATQKPSPTPPTPSASPGLPSPQPARLPIRVKPPAFQANAVLESAYAAFQRGELDRARTEYQQVLGREANNRDAMLGLAAIDVRTRDYETAELRYLKLIELDPRDAHAHGALIAIQGNLDPVQLESRIKNMIASQPDATHLYFTLGNQYAAQSRWSEAQDAYFKAYSAEPDNADFAFNLAVSLDQLRQRRPAAEYYRKALGLAGNRVVGFDRKQAETRARELER